MKTRFYSFLACLIILNLVLAACSMTRRDRPGLTVRMVRPGHQGTILPMGVSVQIQAQAFAPGGGVRSIRFYANGLAIGSASSPTGIGEEANAEVFWIATEAGEYIIQAEAIRATDSAISGPIRVCVFGEELLAVIYAYGFEGPCQIRDRIPDLADGSFNGGRPYNNASIRLAYGWSCPAGAGAQVLSFTATVDDPADWVAFVIVQPEGPASAIWERVSLTQTAYVPLYERIFTGSTHELATVREIGSGAVAGSLSWTAYGIARDGVVRGVSPAHSIPTALCTRPVITAGPTASELLVPSEANCPPGTYYAPVTNRCIAIQLPAPGEDNGDGGQPKCSSHGSNASCSAAGCSWDIQSNTCK